MKARPKLILILLATGVVVTLLLSCGRSAGPVAVRAYLFTGEPTPPGYGAYGYLVFNEQPSETETKRYEHVCETFRLKLVETWGTEGQRASGPAEQSNGNVLARENPAFDGGELLAVSKAHREL